MAPISPPAYQQVGSYSARLDRLNNSAMLASNPSASGLASRGGVRPTGNNTALRVFQRPTPDRWVSVSTGSCFIPSSSVVGGTYTCHNDNIYDVQTAAPHATLARRDLVVARVYDAVDDTGSQNKFAIEVVTGTPAGAPTLPPLPSQSLALAGLLIPAGSSAVTNANITDLRQQVVNLGGIAPIKNASEFPGNAYPGQAVFREDIGVLNTYSGVTGRWNGIFDDSYWFAYGCLGWGAYDLDPDWSTNNTAGAVPRRDASNNVRLAFTMPPNVPASRVVRIETIANVNITGTNPRAWIQHQGDSLTLWGLERRMTIPADSFYYEINHTTLVRPGDIAPGSHYVEPKVKVDNAGHTVTITSMEMGVYLL